MKRFPVAVTGVGVICAIGTDVDQFWSSIVEGRPGLGVIRRPSFSIFDAPIGGEVDDDVLDAAYAELGHDYPDGSPSRPIKFGLLAASEAVRRSGLDLSTVHAGRIGVVVGKCNGESRRPDGSYKPINHPCEVIAAHLGARGPRVVVSTACAAGTNAIGIGRDKLWSGEADVVLAGGVDSLNISTYGGFLAMQAVSKERCAPYSRSGGLNLGEGSGFLVLEPLDKALARGADVLAELRGYGLSADAYHATAPDPTGRGAAKAVQRALGDAQLSPDDVDYVNGHGTGTQANDKMERKVMRSVFGDRVGSVPISSLKSFTGHSLGAAGAIEAVASVMAVVCDVLPPTMQFDAPNADLDFVPNHARPHGVDVVVSNSYAFGGNNASLVLSKPGWLRRDEPREDLAEVHVTGIGLVGGLGIGREAWTGALADGTTAIGEITGFRPLPGMCQHAAEMPELEAQGIASTKDWRHMNSLTRQALTAARLALADSGLALSRDERDRTAVILGTAFGPAGTSLEYDDQPPTAASPLSFAQAPFNAAAGTLCQVLGLRGPTSTITSGAVSGVQALAVGAESIALGRTDIAVVVATDELFPLWLKGTGESEPLAGDGVVTAYVPDRAGRVLGSAAVAFVLESGARVASRDGGGYCRIAATVQSSAGEQQSLPDLAPEAYGRLLADVLVAADVAADDIDLCVGWACGHDLDDVEANAFRAVFADDVLVAAPKELTGDCMAASGAAGVAVAALAMRDGRAPMDTTRVGDLGKPSAAARHDAAIRCAVTVDLELAGAFAAVVLTESTP